MTMFLGAGVDVPQVASLPAATAIPTTTTGGAAGAGVTQRYAL